MKPVRWLVLGFLALLGSPSASSAATALTVDARQAPPPIETGYLHFGTNVSPTKSTIGINSQYMTMNGRPWLPVMGEIHFTRVPSKYWDEELSKMKAAGVDIVATYIIWNHLETAEGHFNWKGDRDLRRFVTLCAKHGFKVFLRPGPWVHSEARFGGIPDWVTHAVPARTNDPVYLRYVARYWGEIAKQVKGLLWKNGGSVIGVQIENEYNLTGAGQGREHIATLKHMAVAAGFDVPLYTVTGWDNTIYPHHEVTPVEGGYPDQPWDLTTTKLAPAETYAFRFGTRVRGDMGAETANASPGDANSDTPHTPFLGAEFGGGLPTMYRRRPILAADDIAAMLPVQLGSGVNLYGYYMFHGGQNSPDLGALEEKTSIGAYNDLPMIDYDFQAPLGAYGQQHPVLNKIRPIHYFLQAFGADLAPMAVHKPDVLSRGSDDLTTPRFSVRSLDDKGFLFVSNYVRQYAMAVQKDVQFTVELPRETVTFPAQPIDIPSGAYFIWPVNMDLSGAKLVYATAQPVTRVEAGKLPVYVFRAQDGILTEFAFDDGTIVGVTAASGEITHANGRFVVANLRAGTDAVIDVKTSRRGTVRVIVLAGADVDRLSLAVLEGHTHLILTDAELFADSRGLSLLSIGEPRFRIAVYPALSRPLAGNLPLKKVAPDGLFQVFEAQAKARTILVRLTKIRDAQPVPPLAMTGPGGTAVEPTPETFGRSAAWTVSVPAGSLNGLEDAFLRIRARGDVARLFAGMKMIDDRFLDGRIWEVGLKRFTSEIKSPLMLTVLPMRKDASIYLDGGVAQMVTGDQTAEVVDVSVAPEYRLSLRTGATAKKKR